MGPVRSIKPNYPGQVRQIAVRGLGHEHPTVLITNDRQAKAKVLIERYASRMNIEQRLAESIRAFHIDALSSAVPLNVDLDVVLSVLAGAVCAAFRRRLRGHQSAARHPPAPLLQHPRPNPDRRSVSPRSPRPQDLLAPPLRQADLPSVQVPWWDNRQLTFELA